MLSSKGGRKHWTWAALPVLGARLRNFFSEPAIELDEAWLEHVSILGCFADCGGNIDSLSSVAWPNDDQIKEAVARRSCAASGPGTTTLEKQIWLGAAYLPQLTGRTLALDKTLGEVVLARFQPARLQQLVGRLVPVAFGEIALQIFKILGGLGVFF